MLLFPSLWRGYLDSLKTCIEPAGKGIEAWNLVLRSANKSDHAEVQQKASELRAELASAQGA